jgi:hypothetical protein
MYEKAIRSRCDGLKHTPPSGARLKNDSCPIQVRRAQRRGTHNAADRSGLRDKGDVANRTLEMLVERPPSRAVSLVLARWYRGIDRL